MKVGPHGLVPNPVVAHQEHVKLVTPASVLKRQLNPVESGAVT